MNGHRRSLRRGAALLGLVVLLGGTPGAASADTPISHSGKYGAHALVDSTEFPGAWCDYNSGEQLYRIRVRWPHVEGYNHTPGSNRDFQRVSYRIQIWRAQGMTNTLHYQSTLSNDNTYDNEAAFFPSKIYNFPTVAPVGYYSVRVQMFWYKPSNIVVGNATHAPDYVRHVWDGTDFFDPDCYYIIV